jgi:CHRD domain
MEPHGGGRFNAFSACANLRPVPEKSPRDGQLKTNDQFDPMNNSRFMFGLLGVLTLVTTRVFCQELLHQEGFNDDGAIVNPPRYSVTGGFHSEVPHDPIDVGASQLGPVYWARNEGVSFVGVPAPTAGRRAVLLWDGILGDGTASADMLKLVANTVRWLARNVPNATVVFTPNIAAAQGLATHLSALGYVTVDDDGFTSDTAYPGDVIVKGPGGVDPSRFGLAPQGVLTFSALDHDDMLVSSIGVTALFDAGPGTIEATGHTVTADLPVSFTVASGSFTWNLIGDILPGGATTVASMIRPDLDVRIPLLVLLNGPTDTPPGSVFGGGPFSGFEGTGFFAGSGLNKWLPEDISIFGGYRSVRLKPVNVAGKSNVKVTAALAASFLDFETSDFLDLIAYPNGEGGGETRLARYSAPLDTVKYFEDVDHGNINRLGLTFRDVTYDVPAGATDLIIEVRSFTSWWNEIVGFDNIRITAGLVAAPLALVNSSLSGGNFNLTWTGGQAPFVVQWSPTITPASWIDLYTTTANSAAIPVVGSRSFVRVQSGATRTVKLFKSSLSGANEIPAVDTPATGSGILALDGNTLTYYVSYSNLMATATLAHLHGPAPVNGIAPPLFDLIPTPAFGTSGILSGTRMLTAAEVTHLEGGQTYVNVHSGVHGGGEIRGQAVHVP